MRETLTALAVLLIVLLTAALAAPYFVDWNAQRAFVEARLSHALGQKVTIGGSIDLKLLPTPYLVLDQAVIGGDDEPISMGIRHLDLELSITPLLHGEFDIVEARLEEPTIRVTLQKDRTLPPLPPAPAFDANVRFDAIAVVDGTLAIADPASGRTMALEHLDFEAQVESLSGPFKGSGAAGSAAARTKFRFAAGAAQNGKTRAKLVVDETAEHAGFEADGALSFSGADTGPARQDPVRRDPVRQGPVRQDPAGQEPARQAFDGTVALFGHLADGGDPLLPWRLSGAVHADSQRATLRAGELRLGLETHGLLLAADGDAGFGDAPALHLVLAGKQLDVDRLFGADPTEGGPVPAASGPSLPDLAVLRRALAGSAPVLPTTVDFGIETATVAGETLADLRGAFTLGASGAAPLKVEGDGPGRSHLMADGTLAPGADVAFQGRIAIAADDSRAFLDWLQRAAPGLVTTRPDLPFSLVEADGQVTIGRTPGDGLPRIEAKGLTLRLDRSSLTAAALFLPAESGRPALFKADLQAKALDLDGLPDLGLLRTAASATDLDLRLDAHTIKVARIGDGPLDAGRIRFALARSGARFALTGFRIEGLGGATIEASATFDPDGGIVDTKLDAVRLVEVAALLRRVVPGALSDALAARALALAPARITISAALKSADAAGVTVPKAVSIKGTLGATVLDASLTPDPADSAAIGVTASAAAPEGSVLLRQFGVATLPLNTLGASRITLEAHGPLQGALAATVHAALGASTLDFAGPVTVAATPVRATGMVKLASPDVSPLVQTLAVAFPDMAGRIPVEAAGGLALTPTGLSFADLTGRIAGVGTSGALQWRTDAKGDPALTGRLRFERLSLATLLGLSLGPTPAGGGPWSTQPFGSGLIDPPRTVLDIDAPLFDLGQGLSGRDAAFSLGVSQGLVTLKGARAVLAGGEIRADVAVRRDGPTVAVEGKLALAEVGLDLPSARGAVSAHIDFAGSGRSPLALVASLSGTGEATIGGLLVPHADPGALSSVFADVEADRLSVDEETLQRALDDAAKAPWSGGTRAFALSLAAGVLHGEGRPGEGQDSMPVGTSVTAAVDLRKPAIEERLEQTLRTLPKNWSGLPPRIVVTFEGPLKTPGRSADISAFINALATRALARESARIEAYEFDVHERAFFNQRLQSERRHEQERVKAEEDARLAAEAARKAEAERRAKDAAAKLERARKAEDARLAQERAEKAAQDRAAQDRAAQDRAAQEKASQERAFKEKAAAQDRVRDERAREEQARARAAQERQQDPLRDSAPGAGRPDQPASRAPDPSPSGLY